MNEELEVLYKRLKNEDWTYMCAIDKQLIMSTIKQTLTPPTADEIVKDYEYELTKAIQDYYKTCICVKFSTNKRNITIYDCDDTWSKVIKIGTNGQISGIDFYHIKLAHKITSFFVSISENNQINYIKIKR